MGKKKIILVLILFLLHTNVEAQKSTSAQQTLQIVINSLRDKYPDLIEHPEKYKFKVLYTEIDRSAEGVKIETVGYRADQEEYLYPASLVKLPTMLIEMEEINRLQKSYPSVSMYSKMKFKVEKSCLPGLESIQINKKSYPVTLDLLNRQMLAVSDNDAYNRVFDFCGQQLLNSRLKELGFNNAKIIRKFVLNCSLNKNRISDPFSIYGDNGALLYSRRGIVNTGFIAADTNYVLGKSYIGINNKLVAKPFDFSYQNNLNLTDIHKMMNGIVFPQSDFGHHFSITEDQRNYLLQNLGKYPNEYGLNFDEMEFFPTYKKYLYYGRDSKITSTNDTLKQVRSFNMVGISFGCVIDASYLVDVVNGKESIITVGVYANKDEVINDAVYDYEDFAYPLFKDIGRLFMDTISPSEASKEHLKELVSTLELQ